MQEVAERMKGRDGPVRALLAHKILLMGEPGLWQYLLGFRRWYWKALKTRDLVRFWFARETFAFQGRLRRQQDIWKTTLQMLRVIAGQFLLAIVLVGAIELLERWLRAGLPPLNDVSLTARFVSRLPTLLADTGPDQAWRQALLSSLAEIAGVYLGLYYAVMAAVISTAYARVPDDIRSLVIEERVGNVYIRLVILLAGMTLLLLAANAAGLGTGLLSLSAVALLGVIALISLVPVGVRTFYFLDPASLLDFIAPELYREIRSATIGGFGWQDPSFQVHYQRRAQRLLSGYAGVVSLATSQGAPQVNALVRTVSSAFAVLQMYSDAKLQIPTDSQWFRRTHRHKNWFTANYLEIHLSLGAGVPLQPQSEPNYVWFEEEIEGIAARIIGTILAARKQQSAVAVAEHIYGTLLRLANTFCALEALHLYRALGPVIRREMREKHQEAQAPSDVSLGDARQFHLALADLYGYGLIQILLGFAQSLSIIDSKRFAALIDEIDWRRPSAPYRNKMPRLVIAQLEQLQLGLAFEWKVEGKLVTPPWYRYQVAALGLARYIATCVDELTKELEMAIADEARRLSDEGQYLVAVQVAQRGIELCGKLNYHLRAVKECFEQISDSNRSEPSQWPEMDWKAQWKRIDVARDRLLEVLAESLSSLQTEPSSTDLPDYFGYAYSVLANECCAAMASGKDELFQKIYGPLFVACLCTYERLWEELPHYHADIRMRLATDPIRDLLALSGLALIYSELDRKPYWETAKACWDAYLSQSADPHALVQFFASVADYRTLWSSPRDVIRTSWQQHLEALLRGRGLLTRRWTRLSSENESAERRHTGVIINVLARTDSLSLHYDPEIVFLAVYIAKRPEAAEVEMPRQTRLLIEALERRSSSPGGDCEGDE